MLNQVSLVLFINISGISFTMYECLLDQKTLLCIKSDNTKHLNLLSWRVTEMEAKSLAPALESPPSQARTEEKKKKKGAEKEPSFPSFPKEGLKGTFVPQDGQHIVAGTESGPNRAL